ncbi:hypothetical protein ACN28S_12805 [Cystobacter fuscus]
MLDTSGIRISTAINSQHYPAVAHDGTNFLVVWQDYRSGTSYDIYGARVSGTGTVLDTSGIPISTAINDQFAPSVANNGTNFLVVWQDTRSGTGSSDIYGARVSGTGTVLNTNGILISTAVNAQENPAVAYNGADFLVVWQDYRSGTNYDIYGARVSGTGVVRNPSGLPISTATSDQKYPALAREGSNLLVVWQDLRGDDIYGTRVSSTGAVLDTSGILISPDVSYAYEPAVAYDGTNFLVVWHGYGGNNGPNINGAQVSSTGAPLDSRYISISTSANGQYTPAVAHDGMNFLVVWQDYRNGNADIYGVLVSETGEVLDPSGIRISTASNSQEYPSVVHDGVNFLVVWQDYRNGNADIYGARVNSVGTVLDTGGITISNGTSSQYSPSVAHDGVNALVVWHDYRSDDNYPDIYGARVSSNGTVLDTSGIVISNAAQSQYNPVVSANGGFLVVWEDYRSGTPNIYGARLNGTGTVLDSNGIPIANSANYQSSPAVAHNGTNYPVVWYEYRNDTGADIQGARVNTSGIVLDTSGISISNAGGEQYIPAVTYDGSSFLVVWQDYRGGTGFTDIYGARVNEVGKVLDTSGFIISAEPVNEVEPVVTSMGGEYSLVVYRSSHASESTNSERVRARLIGP